MRCVRWAVVAAVLIVCSCAALSGAFVCGYAFGYNHGVWAFEQEAIMLDREEAADYEAAALQAAEFAKRAAIKTLAPSAPTSPKPTQ